MNFPNEDPWPPPTPPSPPPPPHPPGHSHGERGFFSDSSAAAQQDPHLSFAHGGKADFRGKDGRFFNFLSVPGLAVNIKTEDCTFSPNGGRLTVDGSFITEAHIVALVGGAKRKWANVSFWASELNQQNWGWRLVNGTCGGHAFKLGSGGWRRCEELVISVDHASAAFVLGNWSVSVQGNFVFGLVRGPAHRLDVVLSSEGDAAARALPHGVIGQSFSSPLPRNGKVDDYPPSGHLTTSAQAEGAIEGSADLYEVASAHATEFRFSRFEGKLLSSPSPALMMEGTKASSTERGA